MTFFRKKPEKYGNEKVTDLCQYGYSHRSKLERAVCNLIWFREKAGELKHLQHEDHVLMTLAEIGYIADFRCLDQKTGETILIEAKGFQSPTWPIKKRLYKWYGEYKLEIWTGTWRNPVLTEVITPKGSKC